VEAKIDIYVCFVNYLPIYGNLLNKRFWMKSGACQHGVRQTWPTHQEEGAVVAAGLESGLSMPSALSDLSRISVISLAKANS